DGRLLAVVMGFGDAYREQQLWTVSPIQRTRSVIVVGGPGEVLAAPAWAPDERRLAWTAWQEATDRGSVRMVELVGGATPETHQGDPSPLRRAALYTHRGTHP